MPREPSEASRWKLDTDLLDEHLIALPEVPDHLPRRRGRKLHIGTIYRWVQRGAHGKVLESVLLGGVRYTSREALNRFMSREPVGNAERSRENQLHTELKRRRLSGP